MNGQLSDDERSSLFEEIPVGRPASAEETADFIVQVAQSGGVPDRPGAAF